MSRAWQLALNRRIELQNAAVAEIGRRLESIVAAGSRERHAADHGRGERPSTCLQRTIHRRSQHGSQVCAETDNIRDCGAGSVAVWYGPKRTSKSSTRLLQPRYQA